MLGLNDNYLYPSGNAKYVVYTTDDKQSDEVQSTMTQSRENKQIMNYNIMSQAKTKVAIDMVDKNKVP